MKAPVPKYQLVKTLLLARLEREYVREARIPSAIELAATFGVSRVTVEQALAMLEDDGILRREQGRGTFYQGVPLTRAEATWSGLLETVFRQRAGAHTRVLRSGFVNAPARVAQRLGIEPAARVVEIDRVGIIDDAPIMLISMWLLPELGQAVLDHPDEVQRSPTVVSFLKKKRRARFGPIRQFIRATLADPSFAADLGVEVGSPVLQADRIYQDQEGRPVLYSEALYRSDRYSFEVTMKDHD